LRTGSEPKGHGEMVSGKNSVVYKRSPPLYRGTSLIRNTPLLEPYSRTMPRVIWWS